MYSHPFRSFAFFSFCSAHYSRPGSVKLFYRRLCCVPDKRPRIDPFSFRSAEHVYRIVLRKVSAATFSARFSTVEREIQPRPTPFFTPFPRPSRKQPSVILFHRVFNKDRDWAASKALLLLFVKYFLSVSYVTFHRGERYFLYIDYTRFIDVFLPFPNAT